MVEGVQAAVPLIEPVPIEDDLCSGLALIEDVDLGLRFVLFHRQTCYETGETVLVVKRKIVLPVSAVRPALEYVAGHLARRFAGQRGVPRLWPVA